MLVKIFLSANSAIWTTKGFAFPKEISGFEDVFSVDSEGNLVTVTMLNPMEEPLELPATNLVCSSTTASLLSEYGIGYGKTSLKISDLSVDDELETVPPKAVESFREYFAKNISDFASTSPISAYHAMYLAKFFYHPDRLAAAFRAVDPEEQSKVANDVRDNIEPDYGGEVTIINTIDHARRSRGRFKTVENRDAHYFVFYRSDRFIELVKQLDLKNGSMNKIIYSNGLAIFSKYLRSLLSGGYVSNLRYYVRSNGENLWVNMPWRSKIRHIIQNGCLAAGGFSLSVGESDGNRNINELLVKRNDMENVQRVMSVKTSKEEFFEFEIPDGSSIIVDNYVLQPRLLDNSELRRLQTKQFAYEGDLEEVRTKINRQRHRPLYTVADILATDDDIYKIDIVLMIKEKGKSDSRNTRYGETSKTNFVMEDDTGEIKVQMWGSLGSTLSPLDVIMFERAYVKNGILYNSKAGTVEKIQIEEI